MTTVKKSHWLRITLIVLVACGIAGIILAAVLFNTNASRAGASASVLFSFTGAAEGKAPNGYPFDLSGVTADEVLEEALKASGLTGAYTPEEVREHIKVTGVYPEKVVQQMTQYVSLLDQSAESQAAVSDYHPTQYSVTLYADLDQKLGSDQLTGLLKNILTAYRGYFAKTCSMGLSATDAIGDLTGYDYTYRVQVITETADQQSRYAEEMAELAPDFQTNGKGFGEIALRFTNLQNDIDSVNAEIAMNAVSMDPERLKSQYESEINSWTHQLESKQEELKRVDQMMNAYEKEGIIYVSSGSSVQKVENNAVQTYEKLVARHQKLTEEIARLKAKIEQNQAKLADLNAGTAQEAAEDAEQAEAAAAPAAKSEEEIEQDRASVEKRITKLQAKQEAITSDFIAMLDAYTAEEINEKTVHVDKIRFSKPSLLSGAFAKQVIKTAGPLCAVGFMVCMVLLIISRRKEKI